jgi:hypothetical protein
MTHATFAFAAMLALAGCMDEASHRDGVALFGAYCMGSAHGDWHPKVFAMWCEIMLGGPALNFYAEEMRKP